jgi:large subunit ribosomal protein L9
MNMKVILNKDISPLGEEGDVKEVAKGYARNFLFPRRFALPYTERTIKMFEARKDEIAERKKQKREDAASIKERLEALELSITMPAGANGKLYGAVTTQSIMEYLAKQGFHIERKRIEIPGNSIKSTGKYKFTIKLYGSAVAEMFISIAAQEVKSPPKESPSKEKRRRPAGSRTETTEEGSSSMAKPATAVATEEPVATDSGETAPVVAVEAAGGGPAAVE